MQVINFFGGPCCGKSVTAAGLFYHLRLSGVNAELITEYAKDLVYDNNLDEISKHQEFIFAEQHRRLYRLNNKVDIAIVDSPLLLSAIYPINIKKTAGFTHFYNFVHSVFESYGNINIFLNRPNAYCKNGRSHSIEEAKTIDDAILAELTRYNFIRETADSGLMSRLLKRF